MKNWLARLFGTAPATTPPAHPPTPAALATPSAPAAPAAVPLPPDDAIRQVSLAYFRWLLDGVTGAAPPEHEVRILDELARCAAAPQEAAALVPRVPDVIPRLLRSLRDADVSAGKLAEGIARDPSLVADVLREANSPLFRAGAPVRSIEAAVRVLGENGLRILLARAAFRPVIDGPGSGGARRLVARVAPRLWRQSDLCALAASRLAPALTADPFEAYLAALMLPVGVVAALRAVERLPDVTVMPESSAFCTALEDDARTLSAAIALAWALPPFVAGAIARAGRAGTQPLAQAVAQAELAARLRVLVDDGIFQEDEPAAAALLAGPVGRVFAALGASEE
jgi:HD-like signal output (HDOD) protein